MEDEIIVGRNAVTEALRSGRSLNKILIQDGLKGGSVSQIIALAKELNVMVNYVESQKISKLTPDELRHQGVAAFAAPVKIYELDEILDGIKAKGEEPFLLLLDELQDPQNVGALIRTADAAGVHGVLIPQRRACPLNAVVAKVSAGAIEYVPVAKIGNIVQTMKYLQSQGMWIIGADMDGEAEYFKTNLKGPIVLVVGAEGKGLGRLVKENCDVLVKIPMNGGVSSLNVSVAGGILMYDIVRQRF